MLEGVALIAMGGGLALLGHRREARRVGAVLLLLGAAVWSVDAIVQLGRLL